MDVQCAGCRRKINIPDERVPKGKRFTIACPKCKAKITVDPPESAPSAPPPESPAGPPQDPFEFLEEGAKTAIICESDPELRARVRKTIEEMEYHVLESLSPRDSLKQMRFRDFTLVVINERFGARDPDMNHVLKYLAQLPMINRRNSFVVLLSDRFRSRDNMMAFNKSVNLVMNTEDMEYFPKYLEMGLNEHEIFYRVFREAFKEIKGV
ncbi:MAG: hypothetical protein ACLFQQ_12995 [Desulfococcaceae bacterium]